MSVSGDQMELREEEHVSRFEGAVGLLVRFENVLDDGAYSSWFQQPVSEP